MKNKQFKELAVCGVEAVKALGKKNPDSITRFYYNTEHATMFGSLCHYLAEKHIPYNCVKSDIELEKLCGSVHHQGVVAMIPQPVLNEVCFADISDWVRNKEHVILLDRVGNANNLGAIVRSAVFFGIKNLIIPTDEAQSSITTSSYRVAQGGMEYIRLFKAASLPELLETVKNKFIRIGTDLRAKNDVADLPRIAEKKSVFLVLGNEEHGISQQVKNKCDFLIKINGKSSSGGKETDVESLNVAQAAAVFAYELSKIKYL